MSSACRGAFSKRGGAATKRKQACPKNMKKEGWFVNDKGDVAFAFTLNPFMFPFGLNSGVYRFSHSTQAVTPVLVPGVTPAPGGGIFAGTFFFTSINNRGDIGFAGMVPTSIGPGAPI